MQADLASKSSFIILQSGQVKHTPKIPLMNLLDCSFISVHTRGSCESSVFLRDVNAFKQFHCKIFF